MTKAFVDRFAPVSAGYAAFRPVYPTGLFPWLASLVPARSLAWDCATGSGQAAGPLAAYFERVVATDASQAQLAAAVTHPRVEYRLAMAEDSGLAGESVDLVTVAQALHWFDHARFAAECDRVLVPRGVLAVWTYGPLNVDDPAVDRIVQHYYHEVVGPYWPPERALVDSGYAALDFPYLRFEVPRFSMETQWTLRELRGYLGTWSATIAYRAALKQDPIGLIDGELAHTWRECDATRKVTWPLTVLVGRKGSV